MALETKAIIMGMAKYAALGKNRMMYEYALSLASVESIAMPSYEEARAQETKVQADDENERS